MKSTIAKDDLVSNGLCYLGNILTSAECVTYIDRLESILLGRLNKKTFVGYSDNILLYNYFRDDGELLELLTLPSVMNVLTEVIDEDFTLLHGAAINRTTKFKNKVGGDTDKGSGANWHVDSRYVGGRRLDYGFNFNVVIALEDSTLKNGTRYVPNSHLNRERPKRNGDYKYETVVLNGGDVCIIDSGLWHKGGDSSESSRWAIFNLYAPWFVKPYFLFHEMIEDTALIKKISESEMLKQVLHYKSWPPKDERTRISTLQKS